MPEADIPLPYEYKIPGSSVTGSSGNHCVPKAPGSESENLHVSGLSHCLSVLPPLSNPGCNSLKS